ncbi:MAG TPA: hypothetical protein PLB02_04115 [Thermoanaerobaculia bacterium]|nr:hypothetical protein [Thermoanaerobaculia bacterium]HQR66557.1 hypothetical protein [Thermoanaerobaculia bacterium]
MSYLKELRVVGRLPLPRGCELRVRLVSFRGAAPVVDVRAFNKGGRPTARGVFLPPGRVEELVRLLEEANP